VGGRRVAEAELARFGETFARSLQPPPSVAVGIAGELGAGKTTLVRAIARGLGVDEPVTSPTFALVHRYAGRGATVYHVDAYRLKRSDDTADLGIDEALAEPGSVVLIEWPERLGDALPPLAHAIRLSYTEDDDIRLLEVNAGAS
jgi:tRNA threonylcarbamoyladenosine biosynthesis protein TsaE